MDINQLTRYFMTATALDLGAPDKDDQTRTKIDVTNNSGTLNQQSDTAATQFGSDGALSTDFAAVMRSVMPTTEATAEITSDLATTESRYTQDYLVHMASAIDTTFDTDLLRQQISELFGEDAANTAVNKEGHINYDALATLLNSNYTALSGQTLDAKA